MARIKNLNRYQKGILIALAAMAVFFGVLYARVTSKNGFLYEGQIFAVSKDSAATIYSGKLGGKDCQFTVTADKSVTFQSGDRIYGPYQVKEDASAVPEEHNWSNEMQGIEVTDGEELVFRGGFLNFGNPHGIWLLVSEDGTDANASVTITATDGTLLDEDGNVIDPWEPSVTTILELAYEPTLMHKGDWQIWFYGFIVSVITAISIVFADELFRWNLAFRIRNSEYAEPSDWEITSRYIGWTVIAALVLIMYILGLQ